jgi:hypothetical protein
MAAKLLLSLYTLALLATTTAAASSADLGDLLERQESMAEVIRVSTDSVAAAAADAHTMRRMTLFMQRELGPFGIVFNAIDRMPESSVAEVRGKAQALDAAEELMIRHHRELLLGNDNISGACRQSGSCPSS